VYNGDQFVRRVSIVEHQLVGHLDIAGSFLDRVQISTTLPVDFWESGTPAYGVAPNGSPVVSDIRVGVLARVWRHADKDPISIHLGADLWIPTGASGQHAGDLYPRGAPQIVLAGLVANHLRWAFSGGVMIRGVTSLGMGPASSLGSELQLRAALAWTDSKRRFNIGPEAWFQTPVSGSNAFATRATSLELFAGAQMQIARMFQIAVGAGSGVVSALGSPDARVILRLAWAPVKPDKPADRDGDGVPDSQDLCPTTSGASSAKGCPDQDADGVPDSDDLCPNEVAGAKPDAHRSGCPVKDADQDGVPDSEDQCPDQASGKNPDPKASGCPIKDADQDGVPDSEDQCPELKPGQRPDPARPGCPLPDKDGDGIPDGEDACPNLPGSVNADKRKSGCPLLTDVATELRSVQFAKNEAVLLPESFPVLDEVIALLKASAEVIGTIEIAGHADDTGTDEWNQRLSKQRAEAVVRYLVEHGIPKKRLRAIGYGNTRPLIKETTDEARARNRRVEMRVPTPDKKP
jgi:outer membrane protein OmpA-like peptidoglycan-associated protein